MEQHTLVRWLKLLVLFAAACGAALDIAILPMEGLRLAAAYPEFAWCFWPWLVFLWMLSIPCYLALLAAWRIFRNIERDQAFTMQNAEHMSHISFLAAADAGLLVLGNGIYLILGMSHPGILLHSFLWAFIGILAAVASAALAQLIQKAAKLQDESDWTI